MGAVCAMTGILVIAMPIPIIVNNFTRQYQRLKPACKFWEEFQEMEEGQNGIADMRNSESVIGLYPAPDFTEIDKSDSDFERRAHFHNGATNNRITNASRVPDIKFNLGSENGKNERSSDLLIGIEMENNFNNHHMHNKQLQEQNGITHTSL